MTPNRKTIRGPTRGTTSWFPTTQDKLHSHIYRKLTKENSSPIPSSCKCSRRTRTARQKKMTEESSRQISQALADDWHVEEKGERHKKLHTKLPKLFLTIQALSERGLTKEIKRKTHNHKPFDVKKRKKEGTMRDWADIPDWRRSYDCQRQLHSYRSLDLQKCKSTNRQIRSRDYLGLMVGLCWGLQRTVTASVPKLIREYPQQAEVTIFRE
jgi:hypothetical protein